MAKGFNLDALMGSKNSEENEKFFEEDERFEKINGMTDPEEVDAAIELFGENIGESAKGNSSSHPGSKVSEETGQPGETEKKTETDKKKSSEEETGKKVDDSTGDGKKDEKKTGDDSTKKPDESAKTGDSFVTDDFIKGQSEDNQKVFSNFKGKTKQDLAKAAASAIALKDPLLKDDPKVIEAITEKILAKSDVEVADIFVASQKGVGSKTAEEPPELGEIEFPSLPEEDPQVQEILNVEMVKRLKKIYPDMPEDMNSVEYKEWEKDLMDDKGIRGAQKFLTDSRDIETAVKGELQRVVYAQENLKNLYNSSVDEILPVMKDDRTIAYLKNLNDNFVDVNNKALERELDSFKRELTRHGITEKDIKLDLTTTKDKNGSLFFEGLNNLLFKGESLDPDIVVTIGKVHTLKQGALAHKLYENYKPEILNQMVITRTKQDQLEREKLKDESLPNLGDDRSKSGGGAVTLEEIENTTDPTKLDKIIADMEGKFGGR